MAVLSFKNQQGRWELIEIPGELKYSPQQLTEIEQTQARTNISAASMADIAELSQKIDEIQTWINNLPNLDQEEF